MQIQDMYDINRIVLDIEVALQIDGKDYGEKDVNIIMDNICSRIIRQYQLDLKGKKITDDSLYAGRSRSAAVLFIENLASLHSRLCGYLQIVRFTKQVSIKPITINYMGFTQDSFLSFLIGTMSGATIPNVETAIHAIKDRFGSINSCIEKKLILIMIVSYEFGLYELTGAIAEILYLGGKV